MQIDSKLLESAALHKRFRDNLRSYSEGDAASFVEALLYKEMPFSVAEGDNAKSVPWFHGGYLDPVAEVQELHHSDVMLISPSPLEFPPTSKSGAVSYASFLRNLIPMQKFKDVYDWYYTFVSKYWQKATDGRKIQKTSQDICRPVFEQELKLVSPKFVIAMGTSVAADLGKFKSIKMERLTSTLRDITYTFTDGTEHQFKMLVVPTIYDLAGVNAAKFIEYFDKQLDYFSSSTVLTDEGRSFVRSSEDDKYYHIIIETPEDLTAEVDRIMALAEEDPSRRIIAVDMEWKGHYPGQKGASLLTLQFSSAPYEAAVVVFDSFKLRSKGGLPKDDRKKMVQQLNRLLTHHGDWHPRVGGHCLRADLPWLFDLGITGFRDKKSKNPDEPLHDVLWSYMASSKLENARISGGWDTLHMAHAYDEKESSYGLKELAARRLGLPAWDIDLKACNAEWKKENKKDIFGFGHVPDEILHPYAAMDADATRQLAELYMLGFNGQTALLDDDGFHWDGSDEPNPSWKPFWLAQRAAPGFLDMEMTGFILDGDKYRNMCEKYSQALEILLRAFRDLVDWPDFNPRSTAHKQAVLFGGVFGSKPDSDGRRVPIMPDPSRAFNLYPVYASRDKKTWEELMQGLNADTGPSMRSQEVRWDSAEADGARQYEYLLYKMTDVPSPGVDKKVLSLLSVEAKGENVPEYAAFGVQLLSDIAKIVHILDGVLSPREIVWDSTGYHELYKKGHYRFLREDGRIHSSLMPTTTSGRTRSSKPNMQNIGKGSEGINQEIMGFEGKGRYMDESKTFKLPPDADGNERGEITVYLLGQEYYPGAIRTIYHGPPEYLIIEADYTGAELSAVAFASGDETMIDHVRRNALPKDDPDYMDMHSEMACRAFKLNPPERTKKGLKAIGCERFRSVAKSVVFGILYGRGAKSIAFQCKLEGVDVSVDEVKMMIETFFDTYPKLRIFLDTCKMRVYDPGYVETLFGRKRRFRIDRNTPQDIIAQMQREFSNAPIQGTVADAVNIAIFNLLKARYKDPTLDFHLAMQIHDSLVIQVHYKDFHRMKNEIIPNAMVRDNPIEFDGKEYHFSVEQDLYQYWGDKLTDEEADSLVEQLRRKYENK